MDKGSYTADYTMKNEYTYIYDEYESNHKVIHGDADNDEYITAAAIVFENAINNSFIMPIEQNNIYF